MGIFKKESDDEKYSIMINNPQKALIKYFIPTLLATIIGLMFNLTNSYWASQLNLTAIEAINIVSPVYNLIVGLGSGLGVGASIIVGRYVGAENRKGLNNAILHVFIGASLINAVLFLFFLFMMRYLLIIQNANGETLNLGLLYAFIVCIVGSLFFIQLYVCFGILRSKGLYNKAMILMGIGAIINVFLAPFLSLENFLSIPCLNLGIEGIGLSTLSIIIFESIIMLYWVLTDKSGDLDFRVSDFDFSTAIIKDFYVGSLPAILSFISVSINTFICNICLANVPNDQYALKLLNADNNYDFSQYQSITVFTLAWRIFDLFMASTLSFESLGVTLASVALGAKKFDNIKLIKNKGIKYNLLINIFLLIVLLLFREEIIHLFFSDSATAVYVESINYFLLCLCPILIFLPLGQICIGIMQSLKRTKLVSALLILRDITAVILVLFLKEILGEFGIWMGGIFGNIIFSFVFYIVTTRIIKKIIDNNEFMDIEESTI